MTLPVRRQSNGEWGRVKVGKALRLINGRAFKPAEWKTSGLPIIRIQNLNNPEAPFNFCDAELPEKFLVDNGDLLFAWSGTPGTSFGAHIWRGERAWLNQHIFKVLFNEKEFDKRFLQLAINQNLDEYIRAAHGAAGLAHITKGRFEESELPKPDLETQVGIVAEIEKQFTRLEAGVAALRRVQANLKRYRAAVLKAACEGKLVPTEAELARKRVKQKVAAASRRWSSDQEQSRDGSATLEAPDYETGVQLLERILEERREKWSGKAKYKEPVKPDTTNLPPLPEGWAWATVEQLAFLVTDGDHNPPKRQAVGVPHLTAKHVRSWRLDPTECTFISRLDAERVFKRYRPLAGDLIITCVGTVGRTAIVPADFEFSPDRNLAAVRLVQGGQAIRYVNLVFSSPDYQQRITGASGSTAQPHFYLGDLRMLTVPIPPLAEQQRIVAEAERRLSVVEELETVVNANIQRATRLRQSILQRAFEGKLNVLQ